MTEENKDLRKRQNERRRETDEPLTTESMLRDLEEEANDPGTTAERKEELRDLIDLNRILNPIGGSATLTSGPDPRVPPPLTAEKIAELRTIASNPRGDDASAVFAVLPFLLDEVERGRADLEMQRTAIADLQGACDAWEKRAKEAESTTERSRAAVPTLLTAEEVASVNPYLIRARALLKRIEWSGAIDDDAPRWCQVCGGRELHPHLPLSGHRHGCELAALIAGTEAAPASAWTPTPWFKPGAVITVTTFERDGTRRSETRIMDADGITFRPLRPGEG